MKILHLVLCSNSDPVQQEGYEKMQEALNKYYKMFEQNVYTIYYKFNENLEEDWKFDDNVLYIKGTESLVPGILEKSLIAFALVKTIEFDYLVRSNVSTIIDFQLLIKELNRNPIHFYGGGKVENLQWEGGGITDSTWYGTNFACGTSIILTKDAVNFILDNKEKIRKNIVDDVALGIFMREYKADINVQQLNPALYCFTPIFISNNTIHINRIKDFISQNNFIFYRNRCYNCRKVDEIQIPIIVDILMEKYVFKV